MAKHDPTVPTVNKDGKDSYPIRTIGDLAVLYQHLPPEKRELLLMDMINGLKKVAESIEKAPPFSRGVLKMAARHGVVRWIDDDKGKVTIGVKMRAGDDENIFTKEL